jgi:hypothetical protein
LPRVGQGHLKLVQLVLNTARFVRSPGREIIGVDDAGTPPPPP